MNAYFTAIAALVEKDLRLEWRSREAITSMIFFSLLVVVIFGFAFQARKIDPATEAPGLLWIAFTFSGVLGLHRMLAMERENGSLQALLLAPVDRGAIFLAKVATVLGLILLAEWITIPIFSILLRVSVLPCLLPLALITCAGSLGFAAVGVLLATIASGSRLREVLLPLLLYPLWVPVLVGCVELTGLALSGRPLREGSDWLVLLAVYDVIFMTAGRLLFDVMLEE